MGKEKNTIAINGQHYDTSTGEAVTVKVVKSASKTALKTVTVTPVTTKVAESATRPAPVVPHTPVTVKKPVMDVTRSGPKHAAAHQPQSGKTLMRKAVKKPEPVKSPVRSKSKPVHGTPIIIRDTKAAPNPAKLKKAQAVPQSQLITHFSTSSVVPVANHPHAVKPLHPPKPATPAAAAPMLDIKPRPVALPAEPMPLISSADIFQNALKQATAHEQPKHVIKHKKQRSKRGRLGMRLATSSLTLLLLAGFIGYQNMAQINMRLAAKKAGFAASLPEYKPSGFSLGKFTYSPGTVNVSYKSNSDERSFAITQKISNWDDQTLREEFVTTNGGDSYEVVQAEGQTIYVYGKKNATWVANGIWYQVQTNGSLSNHQLIELAASI